MKRIPLTQGQFALVDDEAYGELSKHKWYFLKIGNNPIRGYAQRTIYVGGIQGMERMHNIVMPPPAGKEIDHIDRNRLNNQKGNLRACTHQENGRNLSIRKKITGHYKGVFLRGGVWVAQISYGGKRHHLGHYTSQRKAALAYDEKARECYGQFANVNFKNNISVGNIVRNQPKKKSSPYRGVYYEQRSNTYVAQIRRKGEKMVKRRFKEEYAAALFYDEHAQKMQGSGARLNFPKVTID